MKVSTFSETIVALLLTGSVFLVGCSDPQKQASKQLKAKGYEVTVKDFLVAASAGDVEGIDLFTHAGMDIDSVDLAGNTALIKAASSGRIGAVEKILGMGADPRHVNKVGRDALITAASKGYEDVSRMLLNRGADTSIRDSEGWGALSISAYNGHAEVVSLLSANATSPELDDALLVASFTGESNVINTLLGKGANINARSPVSKTPLMIASEVGKIDAVRVLLQNQANPYAVDLNNQTAANLAEVAGFEAVTRLITTPDSWGTSDEGLRIAGEMEKAQAALVRNGVEETLVAPPAKAPKKDGSPASGASPAKVTKEAGTLASAASDPTTSKVDTTVASKPLVALSSEAPKKSGIMVSASPVPGTSLSPVTGKTSSPATVVATNQKAESTRGPATLSDSASKKTAPINPPNVSLSSVTNPAREKSLQESRLLRESSKTKPMVALNGTTIHSRTPELAPVRTMVLAAFHEESLPIIVDHVDGKTASVRRLDQPNGPMVEVAKGSVIPGTSFKVQEITTKFVSSKEGKGSLVDVSRVKVEDIRSGSTHLLVKDISGQTADTYAILVVPNSQYRYVVKAGDVFQTTQPGIGRKDYEVLDIRHSGVVIKDLATEEVVTIARDGMLNP